jgi:energy-coupling factor transport system permease protein
VQIHPAFFWIWATLFTTSLIRLDETLLSLTAILAALLLIKVSQREMVRLNVFLLSLKLAILAVTIRMIFAIIIGVPMPGQTIFSLPEFQLPDFLVGIRIGGEVTTDRLLGALNESLLFAALIILFGAANSLTTPTKILKVFPQRLYGFGLATAMATKMTPQFAESVSRIRMAQHLRGQSQKGAKSWRRIGTPVLEETLSKSLDLAASLEARGYGINPNPTRYKPIKWQSRESVALLPALYAAVVLPSLDLNPILILAMLFLSMLAVWILK